MSTMHDALTQYVALRRALGTKLEEPARTLEDFVGFLERQGSDFITSELALRWAMEPQGVQRATWARRLGMVRRFAAWLVTIDAPDCGAATSASCSPPNTEQATHFC